MGTVPDFACLGKLGTVPIFPYPMDILYLLIPLSVVIVLVIGAVFWWAIASGQFDELDRHGDTVVDDKEPRP
jgi:cbb3-type cytochrome oxidase maturation protein